MPRAERGRRTDETLAFLRACFAADEVEAHGQKFLFLPRPPAPPIYVGGAGEHALRRAVEHGDGWMPMTGDPERLAPAMARLRELAEAAGRDPPEVVAFVDLDPTRPGSLQERLGALAELGVARSIVGTRYADAGEFSRCVDLIGTRVLPALASRGS